jgi:aspartyl-tRNA(Asn)/glutamyl-tRNA(Gln) amidotransferase subunit B
MVKIGLEIHGYILTKEKLFCDCNSDHGIKYFNPNTNICEICTAQPGAKPMLPNKTAVEKAVQIALILGCKINQRVIWQRKHYNWPDLPKGYQSTISGSHAIPTGVNGNFLGIGITECHIEEDPAAWNPLTGEIDYNRSGSPLIEIVTEPEFKSAEQVIEWLKQLSATLGYIKAIDKNSGLKADVNISIPGGERVEIKNINSFKNIKLAIDYEIKRQENELPIKKETRMFDEKKGVTIKMRSKEEADDYRFISEPDLPSLIIEKIEIEKMRKALPEIPLEKITRLVKKYRIDKSSAEVLAKNLEVAEFFEKVIEKINPKIAVPWITVELLRTLNYNKKSLDEVEINATHFIELLELVEQNKITELKAKEILNKFIPKSFSPKEEAKSNMKISGEKEITNFAKQIISENKKAVEDYKSGKKESLNFLIGQLMKLSNKRADFKTAREILENILK